MSVENPTTLYELFCLCYANLAKADAAVTKGHEMYEPSDWAIEKRFIREFSAGRMNVRSLFIDEKHKLSDMCNYCGTDQTLTTDHIFPKAIGGEDNSNNLIRVCKTCNSSKGSKDLMEWMHEKDTFLPLMIIRRYFKLVYQYCEQEDLLEKDLKSLKKMKLPFSFQCWPVGFPEPDEMILVSKKRVNGKGGKFAIQSPEWCPFLSYKYY